MTQYCPNCNHEFGPEDPQCTACGQVRPPVIQKMPTLILSQNDKGNGAAPVAAEREEPSLPAASGKAEGSNFSWALPTENELAAETPVEQADDEDEDPTEPALPTFWTCQQCVSLNPSTTDYCETCGALKPSATPEKRMAAVLDHSANPLPLPPAAASAEVTNPVQQGAVRSDPTTTKLSSAEVAALTAKDQQRAKAGLQMLSSSLTDVGLSRKGGVNEDSYFSIELKRCFEGQPESFGFYMVADGMGGQAAGEVASRTAIETVGPRILAELAGPWLTGQDLEIARIEQVLQAVIGAAHTRLYDYNHQEQIDSGTTVTACCAVGRSAVFANVGDSRTYLFRPAKPLKPAKEDKTEPLALSQETDPRNRKTRKLDEPARKLDEQTDKLNPAVLEQAQPPKLLIERVTRDQSLVQHLVEQGELTLDEVYDDPRRNVILFALGAPDETVPVDTYHRQLEPGDTILLCSDGLWEMVRDPAIAEVVLNQPDLRQAGQVLVEQANQNGGADNITVILVRVI